jgi:F-box protein 42
MVFSDVWLLSMTDPVWTWREVAVRNPQWGATHMWCHPACKVFHFTMLLLLYTYK